MTNSEARKRMQAQNPAESAASMDDSPSTAPNPTPPPSGPYAANLGDGANGQLSDRARSGYAVEVCRCEEGAYLGARKAGTPCCCERCGFMTADQLAAIVREHAERALAEVEQAIASSVSPNFALRHDGSEDPQAAAYVEGLHDAHQIVRAAREEQDR